jgi:hypothetical protein
MAAAVPVREVQLIRQVTSINPQGQSAPVQAITFASIGKNLCQLKHILV